MLALTQAQVVYLSYSTRCTHRHPLWPATHIPRLSTAPYFMATAAAIGALDPAAGPARAQAEAWAGVRGPELDESWRPNDGVVSTRRPAHTHPPTHPSTHPRAHARAYTDARTRTRARVRHPRT